MPYDVDNPPEKIRDLSPKKQRQWVSVFNSCWEEHHDEAKCHAMAWGVAKKESSERASLATKVRAFDFAGILRSAVAEAMNAETAVGIPNRRVGSQCNCREG